MRVVITRYLLFLAVTATPSFGTACAAQAKSGITPMEQTVRLPAPRQRSDCSVEQALAARRSTREFIDGPLSLGDVGQLLWAAQGITHGDDLRTAPSAGALYPLELYLAVAAVEGMDPGIYHYNPDSHTLRLQRRGSLLDALAAAALGQDWIADSAAVLVFTAVQRRTAAKYGHYAERYIAIEIGHSAENVALQAVALGLGTGFVGAFDEERVGDLLSLDKKEQALYLLPLGRPERPSRRNFH